MAEHRQMQKIKIIDLYGIKFDKMEESINEKLAEMQQDGLNIKEIKVIGDKLNQCAVFVIYED